MATGTYQDKTIQCKECGAGFIFTADEQEFYVEKQFTSEPQRCRPCRDARKTSNNKKSFSGGNHAMKSLTCEMCGGNDLLKNEGVFICQSCRTQYTVEEARKLMIEGPVDVTGSTVKVDNSAKLENLYIIARRAWDNGDAARALRSYEQLLLEDPDNWEPNFYTAYFTGMNSLKNDSPGGSYKSRGGQVSISYEYRSGISSCINRIHGCIDSVFALIEDIDDYDKQKAAADAVEENVEMAASHLRKIIDSEHSRMLNEISLFIKNAENPGWKSQWKPNDKNRDSYKRDVSQMVSLVENRKKRLEEVVGKRRFDAYWEAHQEEKDSLVAERESLSEQITGLNNSILRVPQSVDGYDAMVELQKKIDGLNARRKALGLFDRKGKKFLDEKIAQVNTEIVPIQARIDSAIWAVKQRMAPLEGRVAEIDIELTKAR